MEYLIHLAILVAIYAILALSLNLVVGYTGILSVTHAAFFGMGAYTTAILATRYDINFFLSVLVGIVLSAVLSFLIGGVLSRFRGDFVALGSVGFNMIVWSVMLNWQELTRGPLGIPGIGRPELFGFSFSSNFYFLILCLVVGCLLLVNILSVLLSAVCLKPFVKTKRHFRSLATAHFISSLRCL